MNQIEIVVLAFFVILALGLAYNRRRKGVVYLALILVVLLLAAYTIPFYGPLFYTSPQTLVQPATTSTSFSTYTGSPS
jgi:hypothetical protein